MAALLQQGCDEPDARERAWRIAAELEGHADNAAASALGGLTVTTGELALRVPVALEVAVVVWIPDTSTSTKSSRAQLPLQVPFADAVFNLGHASLLVAALTTGRVDALAEATRDRLHQDRRLERVAGASEAVAAARDAGAWAVWLSGSGPSVAALAAPGTHATRVADAWSANGRTLVTGVDFSGARRVDVERSFGPVRGVRP
jgi:homoserine kinase